MMRRLPGRAPGLLLEPEFLWSWLRAAGVEERVQLACERLPQQPEGLELWDLWLELQKALLRLSLPEELEEPLRRAIQELGDGSFRVQAVLPEDRTAVMPRALQGEFPRLSGTAAVLEAVRLAWAAVLSLTPRLREPLGFDGQVSIRRESSAQPGGPAGAVPAGPVESVPASAPDPCLLRLAELHNRLLQTDSPQRLRSLLDLRPWVRMPRASPDQYQERLLLRAAEAAGLPDVPELLRRGRQAWASWADSQEPYPEAPPGPPPEAVPACGSYRQLAGAPGSPGLAAGPARLLRSAESLPVLPGEILVCGRLAPSRSAAALGAAGLVTEQGGRLSYAAVLAARAGLPFVCGARGALAGIRDGDRVILDGQLGIVGIQQGHEPR